LRIAELAWIDRFYKQVRPWLFVRGEDRVLILPPSRVYRLNDTGLALLQWLGGGRRIGRFPGLGEGERAAQVHEFFCDLRALFQGCAGDGEGRREGHAESPRQGGGPSAGPSQGGHRDPGSRQGRRALERVPYTFDFTRLPVLGEIALTYRCNHRCLFCYAGCGGPCGPAACGAEPGSGGEAEMGLPEVRRVLRVFREEARLPFFSFTGGEPLLRGDLEAMIRAARREGLRVNLITNGTLADAARSRRLHRAGLRTAQVSLESPDAAVHDQLTRTAGSFRAALAGIRRLQAAGIAVQTNTTLNRLNAETLGELPAFLAGLGVRRFSVNLFIPAGRGLQHEELFFPYERTGAVVERVRRQARELGLEFNWYSPIPHCLYNPVARGLGNKSCAAVDGLLSVSPSGLVLPCSSWPEPIGDLLRQPFESIWFSERARYFKEKRFAPGECAGCDRFTACQSACPLYWRYAGTREIASARAAASTAAAGGPAGGAP
jgi:radical SAM protein with 4Fe4S-binding SPASM domain